MTLTNIFIIFNAETINDIYHKIGSFFLLNRLDYFNWVLSIEYTIIIQSFHSHREGRMLY